MDIESLRYPSWCLSRLLDRIIGTKEEVTLRRKCRTLNCYVLNVDTSRILFHSGSDAEGFEMSSSDLDLMIIDRNTIIKENIHCTRSVDDSKTTLLMRREECNPGFVTLELLGTTHSRIITESTVKYSGHFVVSSLLYRDLHRDAEYGQIGHGPCNTYQLNNGIEIDNAHCFECDEWPTEANEFIYRQRLYGWPKRSLLDKIICRGCHLVPIGDKNHHLSHIQWRLSFSAAEKDLIHSFNHTQFIVYGLLKIFLKQFINKFHLSDGILCSYFLKTAMFYSIESTPSYLWRDDLLIPCFWFGINKLITWVDQGYCPNYFVPQNNMFRNKVFGQHRHNLLCVLNQCKHAGWTCIYLCEYLEEYKIPVGHPELQCFSNLIPSENLRKCSSDKIAADLVDLNINVSKVTMHRMLARSLTLFSCCRTQQEKDFSTLLLYSALLSNGKLEFCIEDSTNNKDKYKTLGKCKRLFETLSESIGYEGLICMGTFYYKTGQYLKAVYVLERIVSTWKPYVMYICHLHRKSYYDDLYQHYVCGRCSSLIDRKRSAIGCDIIAAKKLEQFYPAELHHEFKASAPFPIFIPLLPYTIFLLFLCHSKLGNIDRSLSVLHDLEVLTRDKIQGGKQYPVALNMLAICLDKLGIGHVAVELCLISQQLKPKRNGAEGLLDKILSTL